MDGRIFLFSAGDATNAGSLLAGMGPILHPAKR